MFLSARAGQLPRRHSLTGSPGAAEASIVHVLANYFSVYPYKEPIYLDHI